MVQNILVPTWYSVHDMMGIDIVKQKFRFMV